MIMVAKKGEKYTISMSIRRPTIYLDHWALRSLSSDSAYCNRFLAFLKTHGTLFFSWANVVEIRRNTGKSADRIRSFLAEIGEEWFPIEIDPWKVIEREVQYSSGRSNPCFAKEFAEAYYPHIHGGNLSLSTIIDLTRNDQGEWETETIQKLTTAIWQFVKDARNQWRSNPKSIYDAFPKSPFNPNRPTEFTYNRLMWLIIKESFNFEDNDAVDFCHAVVSLACGDFVLLDPHWSDLARKLKMPLDRVRVYSKPQFDRFLQDLERFQRMTHQE